MTRVRYTVSAGFQGELCVQRRRARFVGGDVHWWVFAHSMDPDVETVVRRWVFAHSMDGFYCDLQVMYVPRVVGPALARTHIVLNNTPLLHGVACADVAVEVDARGLAPGDAVRALVKATGLSPRLSVCGWPFCLDDLNGVDGVEGGAM